MCWKEWNIIVNVSNIIIDIIIVIVGNIYFDFVKWGLECCLIIGFMNKWINLLVVILINFFMGLSRLL